MERLSARPALQRADERNAALENMMSKSGPIAGAGPGVGSAARDACPDRTTAVD